MTNQQPPIWPDRVEIACHPNGDLDEVTFEYPSGSQTYALAPLPRQRPQGDSLHWGGFILRATLRRKSLRTVPPDRRLVGDNPEFPAPSRVFHR